MSDNVVNINRHRDAMIVDLSKSGLSPNDISARLIESVERASTRTPNSQSGYIIPYFVVFGKPINHYRVKLFGMGDESPNKEDKVRYRQPKDSASHIYFPKTFMEASKYHKKHRTSSPSIIFITEGEKKAALACKLGYPTVGLGGVDSWRNRTIVMQGDPELSVKGGEGNRVTTAKVDPNKQVGEDVASTLAVGMQDVFDYILQTDAIAIIIFDSDRITGIHPHVQRAAATLGYEMRNKGVPFANIRQLILPWDVDHVDDLDKLGLDDYLMSDNGIESFNFLLRKCLEKRSAFPRHPSVYDYISKRLQKPRISRKESINVSLAILCELDANGLRLRSPEEKMLYYFDQPSKTLMRAGFLYGITDDAHDTAFGGLLYRKFGISAADQKILVWLSAQFNAEIPISEVSPERVIARNLPVGHIGVDRVRYQINDGQYCTVDAESFTVQDNGSDGTLFESGHIKPIIGKELLVEFNKRMREPVTNWWSEVLQDVRLRDHDMTQKLHSLLYYLSPWLYRWRGMQLPVELILGESGSGKSTLLELRLAIITGDPRLRNSPRDMKDFHASIINSGALHVTDNVQLTDKQLRQYLSDELCRLITEPHPVVEQRRYFTNAELVRYPVRSVFALTAIQQPFQNADIMQRAVILELNKPADGMQEINFDMNWANNKIEARGGRTAWISHHMHVLSLFFKIVAKKWNQNYSAKHRLINFEQSLMLMAEVFGMDNSWIPEFLVGVTDTNITNADWAFEGINKFVDYWAVTNPPRPDGMGPYFLAGDISEWARGEEEFQDCELLINTRRLGRYIQAHKSMLANIVKMVEAGTHNNRVRYKVIRK